MGNDSADSAFRSTRWSLVLRSRGDAPHSRAALGELCEVYWAPVFRFLCSEGRTEDDSRELTQEFFAGVLGKNGFEHADPVKGRFRSYLLGALKHFLADRRRSEGREKRGGNVVMESIESAGSETSPGLQIPDPDAFTTDAYFDRHWALAVMERALDVVRKSFDSSDKGKQFDVLKPWLAGDADSLSQSDAAAELGMTTGAVKVAIHRLRQKFGDAIRSEISETVDRDADIQEELRYLIEALRA
jgi:DNA-directed RNA polymerase specialized sigma24 family protein